MLINKQHEFNVRQRPFHFAPSYLRMFIHFHISKPKWLQICVASEQYDLHQVCHLRHTINSKVWKAISKISSISWTGTVRNCISGCQVCGDEKGLHRKKFCPSKDQYGVSTNIKNGNTTPNPQTPTPTNSFSQPLETTLHIQTATIRTHRVFDLPGCSWAYRMALSDIL